MSNVRRCGSDLSMRSPPAHLRCEHWHCLRHHEVPRSRSVTARAYTSGDMSVPPPRLFEPAFQRPPYAGSNSCIPSRCSVIPGGAAGPRRSFMTHGWRLMRSRREDHHRLRQQSRKELAVDRFVQHTKRERAVESYPPCLHCMRGILSLPNAVRQGLLGGRL